MTSGAYYNENDPNAGAWLRELIKRNLIAPGDVDERSIEDVCVSDLSGYTQCHFFAGIGLWSRSLRDAGWSDDRPVWTGSCPCQPFSAAGKGEGFADERHLWPAWYHLIRVARPRDIFGEQVANKDGLAWLDLVQADLEALGYTSGAVPMAASGFGAPHRRERIYFFAKAESGLAHSSGKNQSGWGVFGPREGDGSGFGAACERSEGLCTASGLDDSESARRGLCNPENVGAPDASLNSSSDASDSGTDRCRPDACWMGDAELISAGRNARAGIGTQEGAALRTECDDTGPSSSISGSGPINGQWRDADWLFCRDGKWRPVESGTFPLADGSPARVVRLRGYGNGIVVPQAKEFIQAVMAYLSGEIL